MSSSLDKLKALNNKLEDKLAQKRSVSSRTSLPAQEEPAQETALPQKEEFELHTTPASVMPEEPLAHPLVSEIAKTTPSLEAKKERPIVENAAEEIDSVRTENREKVHRLYEDLDIKEKVPDFESTFLYKAMNLSGIGLREEDFGEVRSGKYIQIIAITYEPDTSGKKKAKNVSLGYYGKGDTIEPVLKNKIMEFILRWRYEKAFQNMEHYKDLLSKIKRPETLF